MDTKKRVCLTIWGRGNTSAGSWIDWIEWAVGTSVPLDGLVAYIGVDAPGFSAKAREFGCERTRARVLSKLNSTKDIDTIGIYFVPEDFSAVSTDYVVCFVRSKDALCIVFGDSLGEALVENADEIFTSMSGFIHLKRAELFENDASEEPWFYVTGLNSSADIEGFRLLRAW